ncbi:protein CHROMATIN REMODELING 4 isoform X2 [Jatropha curcas]|uniref:protein CHROMATIN REMODELING 4 isoform X2 n=1 Tax=Jatropha curcas TaxID=180498 RepID=UPI0009D74FD9|nr:protein CHROMATIN REMODELING 4 isoform X2 [Jatropha curcas]
MRRLESTQNYFGRKGMDFDLKSQSHSCIAKLCDKLTDISVRKVVQAQECIARSPPRAKTAVSEITNGISVSKDAGRTESISGLSRELTEEDSDVAWGEESYPRPKNGVENNGCAICMLGGELLCCVGKGCQRSYHLSCLNPPLVTAPPGVWHCTFCVEKKMNMGVHSVSKGVESVWAVREVASDNEGKQKHKEYLVKHQGLAHVHNLWIPEKELLLEAPTRVAKFNRRSQATSWKTEWSIPQRLLQKRQLSFSKHRTNGWLVKWTGLSYDHATWELENASFLTSPEARKLIQDYEDGHAKAERKDYENCHDKADKMQSLSQANEEGELNISTLYAYQSRKANFSRLSQLSSGDSPGAYNHYLKYVNKLREHWYKGHNAIVFYDQADQERILKVILFILYLQHIVRRPLLIISSANALSVWEAEFLRVASSVNFIVYEGNKDVRNSIRSLEFYNEGSGIVKIHSMENNYN